jgi:hypothetical protein
MPPPRPGPALRREWVLYAAYTPRKAHNDQVNMIIWVAALVRDSQAALMVDADNVPARKLYESFGTS